VGGTRGTHWRGQESVQGFGGEKNEGKTPLGRPRRKWGMGSEWILEGLAGKAVLEWIPLPQDMDRWQASVNTVMNLRVMAPQS
jgi:hypothetical protein